MRIFRTPFPKNTSGGLLLKKRSIIEIIEVVVLKNWKQLFTDVLEKAFAMKTSKIFRYTLVSKSLISAYQRDLINFIKKNILRHKCIILNFVKCYKQPRF